MEAADTTMLTETVRQQITLYSIIAGLSILVVCVAPCVVFALISKCFQSQSPRRRSSTLRSVLSAGMKLLEAKEQNDPLDSAGFGAYGPLQLSLSQLDCIERIVSIKSKLPCVTMWKAYAPAVMMLDADLSERRLVAIKKLNEATTSDLHGSNGVSHSQCLRSELQLLSQLPPHHHLQNLLGVCLHNSNPVALIMEYSPFGPLYTYLVIKRRAMLSQNTSKWAGLNHIDSEESLAIKALDETDRACLSPLLDDYDTRKRAFDIPLCESFSEVDVLLFGLQIASALNFLCDQGFPHKRLSTESILIGPGFYLKIMGMDFEVPMMHRTNSGSRVLRRTASGRNHIKWDAPEVMEKDNSYTESSEVWRFGMTLWEICAFGDTPFEDIPTRSLVDLLGKGEVPGQQEGMSNALYSMIRQCWNVVPSDRPTFYELVERIQGMLRAHEFSPSSAAQQITAKKFRNVSATSETALLIGSPSSDQDSVTGSLIRRPSRRPIALPVETHERAALPSVISVLSASTVNSPLLDDISPGYLETDV